LNIIKLLDRFPILLFAFLDIAIAKCAPVGKPCYAFYSAKNDINLEKAQHDPLGFLEEVFLE
jgi:hypothetical protein